mmetsp:Transcript_28904/g.63742  ORF Transcript_28904/g.63742 Transcript_28904/m.63742 type:complete len:325 (-) Transcript_28904:903-1877(-)|eukprot:CAMPEP_0202893718 /NCGR_PEP_ID=MMETSP1392-20130828/3247_1 /ASSEMBLY_ACC=CAM_ASM_000868 /TAXON_ID=225041 /ORGANISM="Chlamydomonas chlamydogama, Strain SAG 11-48b" /LENGTH=324 /DNA_ID=CAMNT_0049578151 /DNA_START=42 /DNA_END=1016 /DNA_ORIENTATION=+
MASSIVRRSVAGPVNSVVYANTSLPSCRTVVSPFTTSCKGARSTSTTVAFARKRNDYLDFDDSDRFDDAKAKYDDYVQLDGMYGGGYSNSRRNNSYIDFDFDPEDNRRDPMADDKATAQQRVINGKQVLINREIKSREVRVIGLDRENMGVRSLDEALQMALAAEVDLVLINPDQQPPLTRLITWSKYKFEIEKEKKERKKGQAVVEIKEVRLRPSTDNNDLSVKLKSAQKFLEKGNKVKITMKFEGRELQFKEQGKAVLLKFIEELSSVARVEGPLNFKSATYMVMLTPGAGSSGTTSGNAAGGGKGSAPAAAATQSAPATKS